MEIHIGDRIADITLVGKEGNKVQLTIDGKPYEVDIVMAENGSCSILHNGNSFNVYLCAARAARVMTSACSSVPFMWTSWTRKPSICT